MNCKNETCPLLDISLIPLTKGKFAIVDTTNYEWLNRSKWHWGNSYAYRTERRNSVKTTIAMHRQIARIPQGLVTDHANDNTLDNRRMNLRACTVSYNHANKKKRPNLTSKYKGVCFSARDERWVARIKKDRKVFCLGNYKSEDVAARAYDQKALELYGEFARLNFAEAKRKAAKE